MDEVSFNAEEHAEKGEFTVTVSTCVIVFLLSFSEEHAENADFIVKASSCAFLLLLSFVEEHIDRNECKFIAGFHVVLPLS